MIISIGSPTPSPPKFARPLRSPVGFCFDFMFRTPSHYSCTDPLASSKLVTRFFPLLRSCRRFSLPFDLSLLSVCSACLHGPILLQFHSSLLSCVAPHRTAPFTQALSATDGSPSHATLFVSPAIPPFPFYILASFLQDLNHVFIYTYRPFPRPSHYPLELSSFLRFF